MKSWSKLKTLLRRRKAESGARRSFTEGNEENEGPNDLPDSLGYLRCLLFKPICPMKFWSKLRTLVHRRKAEAEMSDEIRLHLELQTERNIAAGMDPTEALYAAQRMFGGVEQVKERCREQRGCGWLEDLVKDVRFGARMLGKSPGFTAVAVLTLALGIGANTAISSIVYGVLLRPLPYPQSNSLVTIKSSSERISTMPVSFADYLDWRARQKSFDAIGVARSSTFTYVGANDAERLEGAWVSHDLFAVLGFTPLHGRLFTTEDDKPGAEPTAIIQAGLGRRLFGGRDSIAGEKLNLSGQLYTIVGVMPDECRIPFASSEVWLPIGLSVANELANRSHRYRLDAFARLKSGVSLKAAQADMRDITSQLAREYPVTNTGVSSVMQPLVAAGTGEVRTPLYVLLGAAGFVLFIACANVANLQLARAHARSREFAIRAALGAGRTRVMRQLVVESLMLGLLGCAAGVMVGGWSLTTLRAALPTDLPRLQEVDLNGWVLLFTVGVSLGTSGLFGLMPALSAARQDLQKGLAQGSRSGGSDSGRHWRASLIVAEIALTSVLLVGAGLMIRTLGNLYRADPGFSTEHLVTFNWMLTGGDLRRESVRRQLIERAHERLAAVPGVTRVANAQPLPLTGDMLAGYYVERTPAPEPGKAPLAYASWVSSDFFATLRIRMIAGRTFNALDLASSPRVVIVDSKFVEQHFPGENPLGRRISLNGGPPEREADWHEIVGVATHIENLGFGRSPRPQVYLAAAQAVPSSVNFIVRTERDPALVVPSLRAAMREVAGHLPIASVRTMDELFASNISPQRLMILLLGVFSGLALLLAAVGLYGVLSYTVGLRSREIGVRMALGATTSWVARLVLGNGLKLAGLGLALGLLAALGLTHFLQSLLYGVAPIDLPSFAGVALVLVGIGALACWLPARRAAKVDPMIALRCE